MARIRTLKPENWEDEAVGTVSRDARLLRDVLITYADDDGRWRHLPVAIHGFGYPYDEDVTPAMVQDWARELVDVGLIVVYEAEGRRYGCFPRWHLHQVINKYQSSDLPACEDPRVLTREQAREIKAGRLPEDDGSPTGTLPPHAQARTPLRSVPGKGGAGGKPTIDYGQPPSDFPEHLKPTLLPVVAVLQRIAATRGAQDVTSLATARAMASYPKRPHLRAAEDLEHWLVHGTGQRTKVRDVVQFFRNQLDKRWTDEAGPARATGQRPATSSAALVAALNPPDAA